MKRLTEKHVKKSDGHYMKCSEHCQNETLQCGECDELDRFVDRLGSIEDILGDNYDLDRLRELAEADRDGRCIVLPFKLFVGQKIWVIEPESRTGQEKQAWLNTIKAFGHEKIFYQHSGCPVYSETFDNIGKTIFLNHEDAEAALKGERDA